MSQSDTLDLCFADISGLCKLIEQGDISPLEITEAVLDRIEKHNDELRAFITITRDVALEQAQQAEREIRAGNYRGPMHGIPIALKDSIATRNIRTTCASMVDPDWVPDIDATVYEKLREGGAVLVGKANLDEYGMSSNPAFPKPLNPWRYDRTPAGSSSGSAVSVATGMAHGAIGSDTAGSGRAPAHANGIVGLMGTYGLVSRFGGRPLCYSLDRKTVLTRSVTDSAIMMQAIAGHDPKDPYSADRAVSDLRAEIEDGIKGMRIGLARGYTFQDVDPDVVKVTTHAVTVLQDLGATVEAVRLPLVEHCVALVASIVLPEAATIHNQNLRDRADGFGELATMRLDLGNMVPAVDYINAQRLRKQMQAEFRELFHKYDIIFGPARAMRAGDPALPVRRLNDGRELDQWSEAYEYSGIYNLAGTPAIVVPAGFSDEGTPIGVQFAGKWFNESKVLKAAYAFEQATNWHRCRPPNPTA